MFYRSTVGDLQEDMRSALSRVPTSVVVVTTFVGGRPWGVTVSSFTSVTLAPPTVSVCLFSHTAVVEAVRLQGRLGVSVLSGEQADVARSAALPGAPKFLESFIPEGEGLGEAWAPSPSTNRRWDPHDGLAVPSAPSVHGAIAHFDCALSQVLTVGDHTVLFGEVDRVREAPDNVAPLLYAGRAFHSLPTT